MRESPTYWGIKRNTALYMVSTNLKCKNQTFFEVPGGRFESGHMEVPKTSMRYSIFIHQTVHTGLAGAWREQLLAGNLEAQMGASDKESSQYHDDKDKAYKIDRESL